MEIRPRLKIVGPTERYFTLYELRYVIHQKGSMSKIKCMICGKSSTMLSMLGLKSNLKIDLIQSLSPLICDCCEPYEWENCLVSSETVYHPRCAYCYYPYPDYQYKIRLTLGGFPHIYWFCNEECGIAKFGTMEENLN